MLELYWTVVRNFPFKLNSAFNHAGRCYFLLVGSDVTTTSFLDDVIELETATTEVGNVTDDVIEIDHGRNERHVMNS